MADLSDVDPIITDVIPEEEEEVSNLQSDSEIEGASISASQVGPSDVMPRKLSSAGIQRPSSALTVENLRLHEQTVTQEEKSRLDSATSSHRERPVSRGSLGPVRTPGSGTPVRLCSGKSGLGNLTDATTTPGPESARTGSGKKEPLPPIGSDPVSLQQSGTEKVRLSVSRDSHDDRDTVLSSARMSARSERSVSFRDEANRPQSNASVTKQRRAEKSPAMREVHQTKDSDGRERVMISCATETEWSWLEMIKFLGKTEEELATITATIRPKTPTEPSVRSALSGSSKASHLREADFLQAREGSRYIEEDTDDTEGKENEEDVPPLDLDSDSDFSMGEESVRSRQSKRIPKIGPPQIIKYQRESEQLPISKKYKDAADVIGKKLDIDLDEFDTADLSEKEDEELEERIRGHDKDEYDYYDSNQDDNLTHQASTRKFIYASDDSEYRTTPPLSTVGEVNEVCEFCGSEAKQFPTLEMQKTMDPDELYCCKDYQELVEYTMDNTPLSQHPSEELIDIAPHAPYGSKQARRAAKERAAQRLRDREMARQRAAGSNQANFFALQVARQMKTINYSLSSQKCLDEGWTMRPPTPEEDDKNKKPLFVPEPTTPQLPIIFKSKKKSRRETPIVRKEYRTGELFMVMFEDGTGAVFYPSGALAILITSVEKNQLSYYVQADAPAGQAKFLAVFEPNGNGTCYHGNGNVRLNVNQLGGVFTDQQGSVRKRWSWKDEETPSKTPPFQPLCFSLSPQLSIRCLAQDQIFISFSCDLMTCRFNAGAKLKLVDPALLPPKDIDRDMLYIAEVKTYVQMVLDQIFNQKNFSKSPKLDNLRPSIKLQNSVRKNERLKKQVLERKVVKKTGAVVTVK